MNTLSGVNEPYSINTLDGLDATSTLIASAVGAYLPLTGGTLATSGTTRLGIASDTQGTVEFTDTAGASKALMFYTPGNNDVSFTVGTNTRVLRVGGTQITSARNISMASTNRIVNLSPGTGANDAISYTQAMLRNGVNSATADISMGGFKLTGLAYGVAGTDAATVAQLTASPYFYLPLTGGTMSGNIEINRGVNPCIFTLASAGNTTIDFKDNNLVLKGSMQYNQPANELHFDLAGVTRQSISTTAATFSVPVAIPNATSGTHAVRYDQTLTLDGTHQMQAAINCGGFKCANSAAGSANSADCAIVSQMEAADTVVTNAYIAADVVVNSARIAANGVITTNYIAADAVVTAAFQAADALKLNRSGVGAMTGALDMGGFLIQQVNAGATGSTNAANVLQMEAADTVVTNAYIAANTAQTTAITSSYVAADALKVSLSGDTMTGTLVINTGNLPNLFTMASNSDSSLFFTDAALATKAAVIYFHASNTLSLALAGITAQTISTTQCSFAVPLNLNTNKVTNIGTPTVGTDATTKTYVDTKTYLQTSSTSNGSFTIADPSANLTTLTFRNEYTLLGSPLGACYFITEAQSQLWIKANVTTHAKESGIQLDSGTFIFFTGDPSSPTQRFSYDASANNQMNIYGTLNMRTHKIIGVTAGTVSTDGVNYGQTMLLSGVNSMTADLAMGTHKITGVSAGTVSTDAVNYGQTMLLSGSNAMTADLAMGTHKITGVSAGTVSTDAVNYGQTLLRDGTNAMTAQLYMGNFRIGNLSAALSSLDAVNYGQTVLRDGTNAMTGILNMGLNIISNCGPASSPTDVVTYTQITNKFVPLTGGQAVGQAMTGQLSMGTNRIGDCGVALSAADVVVYSQIQQSTIPLTAWRVGETVQRKWYSPKLSNNLSNSTCGPSANVVIVTIDISVTNGNKIFIGGQFNIDANGYNDDQFTMRAGFGAQYMDFVNSMPTGVNFRERTYTFNTVFLANATATKTFSWKIFNESTTDTITISSLNWLFSVEEVQS